nr:homoserine O-acetyltransferase [Angustibacter aerolatus]
MTVTGHWRPGDPVGHRRFAEVGTITLEARGALPDVTVAYETWGTLNAAVDNAVLVLHALTGDSHVAGPAGDGHPTPGWWDGLVGPGRALDTDRWFVVAPNVLGGCQGTTGPSSVAPDGRAWGSRFPFLTVRDQVEAEVRLADALGIGTWASVVGGSMGGMRVVEWAVTHPDRVASALVLASTAAASADQIAWCAPQVAAIRADPAWQGGDYHDQDGPGPVTGLGIARRIAHATYRSADELDARFGRRAQGDEQPLGGGGRYAVESLPRPPRRQGGPPVRPGFVPGAHGGHELARRGPWPRRAGRRPREGARRRGGGGRRQRPVVPAAVVAAALRRPPGCARRAHRALRLRARRVPHRDAPGGCPRPRGARPAGRAAPGVGDPRGQVTRDRPRAVSASGRSRPRRPVPGGRRPRAGRAARARSRPAPGAGGVRRPPTAGSTPPRRSPGWWASPTSRRGPRPARSCTTRSRGRRRPSRGRSGPVGRGRPPPTPRAVRPDRSSRCCRARRRAAPRCRPGASRRRAGAGAPPARRRPVAPRAGRPRRAAPSAGDRRRSRPTRCRRPRGLRPGPRARRPTTPVRRSAGREGPRVRPPR